MRDPVFWGPCELPLIFWKLLYAERLEAGPLLSKGLGSHRVNFSFKDRLRVFIVPKLGDVQDVL